MVNIFKYACPNHSGDGAIDSPDRFEHVFDPDYVQEVLEKIFTHVVSMVRAQKVVFFSVFKAFVSIFLYYTLYQGKLKVITRPQCGLHFFIRSLVFALVAFESET